MIQTVGKNDKPFKKKAKAGPAIAMSTPAIGGLSTLERLKLRPLSAIADGKSSSETISGINAPQAGS